MDFFQLSQGLPDPFKLRILLTTGPAAQQVTFDLFVLFGLQFLVLVS